MSQDKRAAILAVSEGWEDAYIKDERVGKVYYVRAPYFKKQKPIEETILHSSMAYGLIVPEIKDFPSVDAALEHVKKQYETQDYTLLSFEEAVGVILDYAKEINHPLADKAGENFEKREEEKLLALLSELEAIRQEGESILAPHAAD